MNKNIDISMLLRCLDGEADELYNDYDLARRQLEELMTEPEVAVSYYGNMIVMTCPSCGGRGISQGFKHCSQCGVKLVWLKRDTSKESL